MFKFQNSKQGLMYLLPSYKIHFCLLYVYIYSVYRPYRPVAGELGAKPKDITIVQGRNTC